MFREFYPVRGIYYRLLRLKKNTVCVIEKKTYYKINFALLLGIQLPRNDADRSFFSSEEVMVEPFLFSRQEK